MSEEAVFVAFVGTDRVARGSAREVAELCKAQVDAGVEERMVLFDDAGRIWDLDFSGSWDEVLARLPSDVRPQGQTRGPGRPRLGVVSREVGLLPRHWEWLSEQGHGASGTLRRLVEAAQKSDSGETTARRSVEAAHRFLWDIASDFPNFEEATRALFARDFDRFETLSSPWPIGIREQVGRYLAGVTSSLESD